MASSTAVYPMPPLPNKRAQGTIGSDLIITYHSDLAQCQILPPGSRYTNAGNFKAGTFLAFNQPDFTLDLYPRLLSSEDEESSAIPLLLSMFNAGVRTATLEDDWEGKWFTIVARVFTNKLTFHGVRLKGWETDDTQSAQVAMALPRDGGLTPIVPRLLSGNNDTDAWPTSSTHASFAGPVDLDTFHIKEDVWPEALTKSSVFIKLGSYLLPEGDRPPHKGVHIFHVLLLFPIEQQPWSSLLGWIRQAANPFPRGSWIVCSGRILGVLNREVIEATQTIDSTTQILVILPDDWEFVRQSALSTNNVPAPTPSNHVPDPHTPPQPAGPGGVASRNPFSSPSRSQKRPLPKNATSPTMGTAKHSHRKPTQPPTSAGDQTPRGTMTTNVNPMTVSSSSSDVTEHGSDVEQLLDDQLASPSATLTRKTKRSGSPASGRSKRSTAGKRKAQLYE